jgi:hypothetical protein
VVHAVYDGSSTYDGIAVYGKSTPLANSNWGIGGYFEGNYYGVYTETSPGTAAGDAYALRALVQGGNGTTYAVAGINNSGSTRYGVFGQSDDIDNSYAVFCSGRGAYTISWNSTSDQMLKKNIADILSGLDIVMQLNPKSYEYRKEEFDFIELDESKHYGFPAQQLEKVLPELVGTARLPVSDERDSEMFEFKTTNTIELIPILTKAIQEQQAMIEEQRELIVELQEKVNELDNLVK